MSSSLLRKLSRAGRNLPNLLQGYNLYVNRDKLELIDLVFRTMMPAARSFADLGGVWRVNAAYTRHTLQNFLITRGVLVDTAIPDGLRQTLTSYAQLEIVRDDFGKAQVADRVGNVDVVFLFDVLLHQANPDWDEILRRYAARTTCFVIYNQQYVRTAVTTRLTDLAMEEYIALTSDHAGDLIGQVYRHGNELHPSHGKPWKDIHNIIQWGITDDGLRGCMSRLGYSEVFFKNYGIFLDLPAFEEHGFVFLRS